MSKLAPKPDNQIEATPEKSGPNLFLLYGLLALGILAAMAFAAMVVWPFYVRR